MNENKSKDNGGGSIYEVKTEKPIFALPMTEKHGESTVVLINFLEGLSTRTMIHPGDFLLYLKDYKISENNLLKQDFLTSYTRAEYRKMLRKLSKDGKVLNFFMSSKCYIYLLVISVFHAILGVVDDFPRQVFNLSENSVGLYDVVPFVIAFLLTMYLTNAHSQNDFNSRIIDTEISEIFLNYRLLMTNVRCENFVAVVIKNKGIPGKVFLTKNLKKVWLPDKELFTLEKLSC